MRASYGFKDQSRNANLIEEAEEYMRRISEASLPGNIINLLPIFRYVPSWRWIPFTSWRRKLEEGADMATHLIETPYNDLKEKMVCPLIIKSKRQLG